MRWTLIVPVRRLSDDVGQFTEEALVDRMLTPVEQCEPAPQPAPEPEPELVEPTPEEPAEEVTASDDVELEEDETIAESDDDVSDAPSHVHRQDRRQ